MMLDELRAEIDSIDEQMLALFLHRMEIAGKIAQYKAENALPCENISREKLILQWAAESSGSLAPYSQELFRCLFTLSKQRQQEVCQNKLK